MMKFFLLNIIIHCLYLFIVYKKYTPSILVPIIFGSVGQILWYLLASKSSSNAIQFYGVIWDSSVFLVWALLPVFFFSVHLNSQAKLGIFLIILGMLVYSNK